MAAIIITPRKVARIFFMIFSILFVCDLLANYLKWVEGYETAFGFVPAFDFDDEYNVPSLFSFLLLLLSSLLLMYISLQEKQTRRSLSFYWKALGYVFLYLAVDELISFHEHLNSLVIFFLGYFENLNESRMWIIPYSLLLIILGALFLKFLAALPVFYRIRFIVAGLVYISGAIGAELLGDQYMFTHKADFNYGLISTLEESLEMIGIILFIRYLIEYISAVIAPSEIPLLIIFRKNTQ